jgi:hypothetical protein
MVGVHPKWNTVERTILADNGLSSATMVKIGTKMEKRRKEDHQCVDRFLVADFFW